MDNAIGKPSLPRASRLDGQATRLQILEKAGELFAEQGLANTTSKQICERSQANSAAVNYHFVNKEGLYRAVLLEAHARLMRMETLVSLNERARVAARQITSPHHRVGRAPARPSGWLGAESAHARSAFAFSRVRGGAQGTIVSQGAHSAWLAWTNHELASGSSDNVAQRHQRLRPLSFFAYSPSAVEAACAARLESRAAGFDRPHDELCPWWAPGSGGDCARRRKLTRGPWLSGSTVGASPMSRHRRRARRCRGPENPSAQETRCPDLSRAMSAPARS